MNDLFSKVLVSEGLMDEITRELGRAIERSVISSNNHGSEILKNNFDRLLVAQERFKYAYSEYTSAINSTPRRSVEIVLNDA